VCLREELAVFEVVEQARATQGLTSASSTRRSIWMLSGERSAG
jgi:hypothetical protein